MGEWKRVKIGDLCSIRRGASPRPIHEFIQDSALGGMPWVKIADANASDSRYIYSTKESIIAEGINHSLKVDVGDFILSNSATPGLPRFIMIDACVHDGWLLLRDFVGVDKLFLYYKFLDVRKSLVNQANGSVFQNLKTEIVRDYVIDLPDLSTQRRIAAVLGALDDKIEVNRKICENLEAQAQALFKAWFVDFEPFGGKRPEGWKIGRLGDVGEIVGGATPSKAKSEYYTDDGIAWITPKDISLQGTKFIAKGEIDITEKGFKSASVKLMSRGSVLFSSRAPIGYVAIARNDICTNQGFKSVVPKDGIGTCFVYEFLKLNKQLIEDRASGSTFKEISTAGMRDIPVMIPDIESLKRFETSAWPLFLMQENMESESRALAAMRDALLPKLMSGELAVEKVEVADACASHTGQGTGEG